ncbi:rolling circle replication-associated protein [Tsuneonella dongtanensis]|uniref:rolling circle replication-associated protein n=1 Tax=Tsuneonella dongtanensis TaxID=692370 RepID=UPI00082F19D7
MTYNDKLLQRAIRGWVQNVDWVRPFAVTLTLKQCLPLPGGALVKITPDLASRNMRHFLNLLNRRVYGSAYLRHGQRLPCLVALEGTNDKRLHYHIHLDCPREDLVPTYPRLISELWERTDWGHREVDVQSADEGWVGYITKLRDKADYSAAFDWQLSHFI